MEDLVCAAENHYANPVTNGNNVSLVDKIFVCDLCNQPFTKKANLIRHILNIHDVKKKRNKKDTRFDCPHVMESNVNMEERTEIQEFFSDSTVFMTGVTGFLGHVLLSKLLTSCPDVKHVYILMRDKKGKTINERFQEMIDETIFDDMKVACPQYLHKIKPIKGDCEKPGLGLSETECRILENEVNIVFHIAATVRFDAPLRDAVHINVRSTSDLLSIAKNMKQLKAFVHTSTAFSHCTGRKIIDEQLYDSPVPAEGLLTLVEQINDEVLDRITPSLLDPCPNTYVYTKAVAENVCVTKGYGLPIAIFRPAIVISTAQDPVPGWINNTYGPTGIVAAAGVGLLRSLYVDKDCIADVVPCDYVINALIASACYTAKTWKDLAQNPQSFDVKKIPIFNFSSSATKCAITWKQFMDYNQAFEPEMPFSPMVWAYSLTLNKYKFANQIYVLFLHLIPAFFLDRIAVLCGKKPMLENTYNKIHKLADVISYFSTKQWTITNNNVKSLWENLSEKDKNMFNFDLDTLDWLSYSRIHLAGIRKYIVKDQDDTIPSAVIRRRKMLITHYSVITMFICLFSYIAYITGRFLLLSLHCCSIQSNDFLFNGRHLKIITMSKKFFMRPLKVLASPGIYLFGKYNQYKRERQEQTVIPSTQTENELLQLNTKIDKLLTKLNGKRAEVASTPEEECVICVNAKAVTQTYPCGHKVVCRKCFVKTIQLALTQRTLPLRCVICRTKIIRLKHNQSSKLPTESRYYKRFSSCSASRRTSSSRNSYVEGVISSIEESTLQGNSSEYSKSLQGIDRGSSFNSKFSAKRSQSAVVYRRQSSSIRRCGRSCSLSSCASARDTKLKKPHAEALNSQRSDPPKNNFAAVNDITVINETKSKRASGSFSREELIQQFQRDFRQGQLDVRHNSSRKQCVSTSSTKKAENTKNQVGSSDKRKSSNAKQDKQETKTVKIVEKSRPGKSKEKAYKVKQKMSTKDKNKLQKERENNKETKYNNKNEIKHDKKNLFAKKN